MIERDLETGLLVGYVPGFPGAHSQGATVEELSHNLQAVVAMLLEGREPRLDAEFGGTQQLQVGCQRGSEPAVPSSGWPADDIAFRKGRDISPTLLRQIARDIGLCRDGFLARR